MMPQDQAAYPMAPPSYIGETTGGVSMDTARLLLEVENIPEKLKAMFWVWISHEPKLSNLRIDDVRQMLMVYKVRVWTTVRGMREKGQKITWEILGWILDTYAYVYLALMRSVGEERERKLFVMTWKETRGKFYEESKKKGLFGR